MPIMITLTKDHLKTKNLYFRIKITKKLVTGIIS